MSALPEDRRTGLSARTDGAVIDETRRLIVDVLRGESGDVSSTELVRFLAAEHPDAASTGEDSGSEDVLRVRLHHVHLPKLDDRGLIEWDREEAVISATDHPTYDTDPREERSRTDQADQSGQSSQSIADPYRRAIFDAVRTADGPVALDALARRLVRTADDAEGAERSVRTDTVQLHHVHLPKLDARGLIEYDPDDQTARHSSSSDRTSSRPENATPT